MHDFLKDQEAYRDLIYEMVKRGRENGMLESAAKAMGLEVNTIEQWGYRSKQSQVAYFYRVVALALLLEDDALAHWIAKLSGGRFIKEGAWEELKDYLRGACQQLEGMD